MKYDCESCSCQVIVAVADGVPKKDVTRLWALLDDRDVTLDVEIGEECELHESAEDHVAGAEEASRILREWLHDTFGPCAWPKDHPVARAWAELEDAS